MIYFCKPAYPASQVLGNVETIKLGNDTIESVYLGNELVYSSGLKAGTVLDFSYTGTVLEVTLPKGAYKLECWGAQGGASIQGLNSLQIGKGGNGGYSCGILCLLRKTKLYVYSGGMGLIAGSGKAEGGFPNGGSAWASGSSEPAAGGGGESDIRIGQDSLYSRVIVAGGGGGGGEDNEAGGYGGGNSGGTSGSGTPGSSTGPSGYFGIGGHTAYDGGGGGGGWYGAKPAGGSTTPATSNSGSDTSGSPGGSGYVYTESTASNYPSGCLLNELYYLTEAQTIAGNQTFKSPTGENEIGHSGNGFARITVIKQLTNHKYVDLGLPSGTLWATCNIGAENPEDYGDYYAWGETETKSSFSWSNYSLCHGSSSTMTKYCTNFFYGTVDGKTVLGSEDDVAKVKWGSMWLMPTLTDWLELYNSCTWTWTTQNGINGYKVTSKTNTSKFIFLPAAGIFTGSSVSSSGSYGFYWSATLSSSYSSDAYYCSFNSSNVYPADSNLRYYGLTVRPVRKK